MGVLKHEGNKFTLIPASQIVHVEVELPSLVIATSVPENENGTGKLITMG
jgi:hypothetical protein